MHEDLAARALGARTGAGAVSSDLTPDQHQRGNAAAAKSGRKAEDGVVREALRYESQNQRRNRRLDHGGTRDPSDGAAVADLVQQRERQAPRVMVTRPLAPPNITTKIAAVVTERPKVSTIARPATSEPTAMRAT